LTECPFPLLGDLKIWVPHPELFPLLPLKKFFSPSWRKFSQKSFPPPDPRGGTHYVVFDKQFVTVSRKSLNFFQETCIYRVGQKKTSKFQTIAISKVFHIFSLNIQGFLYINLG
jgi:hypothetical protein